MSKLKQLSHPKMIPSKPFPKKWLLHNLNLWNSSKLQNSVDVLIADGVIKEIRPTQKSQPQADIVIKDCSGLTAIPAGVDPQVHLRVPGQPEKELPLTGLMAAVRGGYGAVLTMPNTQPVIDNVEILQKAQNEMLAAEASTGVKVLWTAAITKGLRSEALSPLKDLAHAGVAAFTDDGKGVATAKLMEEAFALLENLDQPLLQHAEMPNHGGVLAPSRAQEKLAVTPYGDSPEWQMVQRDLDILKKFPKARYHVLHVSSKRTLELVQEARKSGLRVTCEVSPHHLLLTAEDIEESNTAFKMNPPLRSQQDRLALVQALANGGIDFVATDHAPHESEKKDCPFSDAAFGTTGLETSLRVLLELHSEGLLTPQRLVEVFTTRPAEFLGLNDFGILEVGRKWNAVLVDVLAKPTAIQDQDLMSLNHNNCFLGKHLAGKLLETHLENKIFDLSH